MFLYLIIHAIFKCVFVSISFLLLLEWPLHVYERARAILRIANKIEFITFIYWYNWIFNFLTHSKVNAQHRIFPFSPVCVSTVDVVAVGVFIVWPIKASKDDGK